MPGQGIHSGPTRQSPPVASPRHRGVVVFHAGANVASRWEDFQRYSQADQEFFDQLLPVEVWISALATRSKSNRSLAISSMACPEGDISPVLIRRSTCRVLFLDHLLLGRLGVNF